MISDRRKQAIIEMAKRGTPEERNIAESIIENLDISIEDETITQTEFKFSSKYEKFLLHQIHAMVINSSYGSYYSSRKKPKTVWFDVTKAQQLEINFLYSIYKRELKQEIDITYSAFLQKNNIFPLDTFDKPDNSDDIEKMRKILDRASTIDKTHIRKQLEY